MVLNYVIFFGCSTTLDKNDLKAIIKSTGFRNPHSIRPARHYVHDYPYAVQQQDELSGP